MEKLKVGPPKVVVYGSPHSPWSQAVLFKLAEMGYSVSRHYPMSLRAYIRHGLVMPLVQWPDGSLTSDSFHILAKLFGEDPDESHRF